MNTEDTKIHTIAFIDGQNLHLGTKESGWMIDHQKFRVYLSDKYNVSQIYYFLGFYSNKEKNLYNNLSKNGYIVLFKEHISKMKGKKKGNVDSDIIFSCMKKVAEREDFQKILLVSGDGDYIKLVEYLIQKNKFERILFPNKKFISSLYKKHGIQKYSHLDDEDIKSKIRYK